MIIIGVKGLEFGKRSNPPCMALNLASTFGEAWKQKINRETVTINSGIKLSKWR